MRSLRGALILWTSIGSVLVFSAAGMLLYFLLRTNLVKQIDGALQEKARWMAANTEIRGANFNLELGWAIDQAKNVTGERDDFEIWNSQGTVVYCSPRLLEAQLRPFGNSLDEPPDVRWLSMGDGREGRALGVRFQPERSDEPEEESESKTSAAGTREHTELAPIGDIAGDATLTLALVRDVAPLNATLASMKLILVVVGCGAAAVSSAVLMVIIGRSLRPLEKLQRDISLLDARELSARIHSPDLPQELLPLVARLNELLGRLEMAFERERGFSADIAHELRTPLAGLRATIEVTLARSRQADEYKDALRECQQITVQLESLVKNLLALVRLESGQQQIELQALSIDPILQDQWSQFAGLAKQRELSIEWQLGAEHSLRADAAYLSIALQNLFANAIEYADVGGWIRFASDSNANQVIMTLANSGSRISQGDVEKVFDRFWRGDLARSDVGQHFGLGLSLVKRIVTAMGGTVRAQSEAGGVFGVSLEFPAGKAIATESSHVLANAS